MKRRKVKLLTVFFVAIAIQITNCCPEIFSNFGLLLVLTVRKAEQAGQHYTSPIAAQSVLGVV
jgi:hypothetical protein